MAIESRNHEQTDTVKDLMHEGAFHFAKGEYEESIAPLTRAIEADDAQPMAYMSRGVAYVKTGRMEEAKNDFVKMLSLSPDNPKAHHFLGLVYLHMGNHEAAKEELDRAIELDPHYGAARYTRGTARSEMGDLDGAGEDMAMAARLGEANLQGFADDHNIWRTRFDKVAAQWDGDREPDLAVDPDLNSLLDD